MTKFSLENFRVRMTMSGVEIFAAIDFSKLDFTLTCIISLFVLNFLVLIGIISQKSKMSLLDSKLNTLINRPVKTPKIVSRSMIPPPPPGPLISQAQTETHSKAQKESKIENTSSGGMSNVLQELSNFKRNVMESYM